MHIVQSKSILSAKNGMNIYRGCSHGCIYCDSRSDCYQMNHDFEDIEIKGNAIELLENALRKKRKKCMIGTGCMTDPYIPLESKLCNMRKALELIDRYGFGVSIITKSDLILRDLDLLKSINNKAKCVVQMTLTTFDEDLCKKIEPNVCTTKRRAEVLNILRDNGIPTVVWLSPILPFINDTKQNIEGILNYCIQAKVYGIICFGMGLTLRSGNREYFYKQLDKHFPNLSEKYKKIYGDSYVVGSKNNDEIMKYFYSECKKYGIGTNIDKLFEYCSTFEEKVICEQLTMF